MEDKVKFLENVVLIDVAFINKIAFQAKKVLGERLEHELPNIDLPTWLSYLVLDAGLRGDANEVQVILLHDEGVSDLAGCEPATIKSLDGMACRTSLGEFVFSCATPAQITTCEELYLELMNLALDSADVKNLLLIPFHPLYGNRVEEGLRDFFKDKNEDQRSKALYFMLEKPMQPMLARWDLIIYSLAQAFGLKADDLK